jgi:hypothetical protein
VRPAVLSGILLALLSVAVAPAQEVARIAAAPVVRQFTLQEITLPLPPGLPAEDDSARVAVTAEFTAPSGRVLRQPAFHWQAADPYANAPGPDAAWKLRFTPVEPGPYVYRVLVARDAGPEREVARGAFECLAAPAPGFIRRAGRAFRADSGEAFFPLGANRCWGDPRRTDRYIQDMELLAASGANTLRVWIAPWWVPLEQSPGRFDAVAAARLDLIVEHAEALGLRLVLCIEQHGNLEPAGGEIGLWGRHPYNAANGGPCARRVEFFTSEEARRLFKNRLRYLVARWGHSTAIMAWELFNEVEWASYDDGFHRHFDAVADWHTEMAAHLRAVDPYGHLIATSSHVPLQRRLLQRRAIDFVQVHVYDQDNLMGKLTEALAPLRDLPAPLLAGEFGLRQNAHNPEHVTLGVLTAALAGAGAGALPWLSDVEDLRPYCARLAAARKALEGVRWGDGDYATVTVDLDPAPVGRVVRTLGLAARDQALVFAWADTPRRAPGAAPGLTLRLPAPGGDYAVEAWNCSEGAAIWQARLTTPGGLTLALPDFARDVLVRCERLRREE